MLQLYNIPQKEMSFCLKYGRVERNFNNAMNNRRVERRVGALGLNIESTPPCEVLCLET